MAEPFIHAQLRWMTPLAPNWLWNNEPPAKDKPFQVIVITLDKKASDAIRGNTREGD